MTDQPGDPLITSVRDRVGYITLNRPERLNALSLELRSGLIDAFDRFSTDPDVLAVLLRSTGDRAFCAGIDLKEAGASAGDPGSGTVPMTGVERNVFEVALECSKPTVVAIFGWTVGAGCELALACDIRIAASSLRIGLPEAKRGQGANFGSQLLPRIAPRGIAYQMLYTGEPIDGEAAWRWGLVNEVIPREDLDDRAEAVVRSIVANAPMTVQRYKAMVTNGIDLPVAAALRLHVGPNPYLSQDRREGVAAFLEKRPPKWQNR